MPSSSNPNRFQRDPVMDAQMSSVLDNTSREIDPLLIQPLQSVQMQTAHKGMRFTHLIAEYCRTPGGFPNRTNFTDWLDQHGQQGWQLVSVVPRHSTLLECFFVRAI